MGLSATTTAAAAVNIQFKYGHYQGLIYLHIRIHSKVIKLLANKSIQIEDKKKQEKNQLFRINFPHQLD